MSKFRAGNGLDLVRNIKSQKPLILLPINFYLQFKSTLVFMFFFPFITAYDDLCGSKAR